MTEVVTKEIVPCVAASRYRRPGGRSRAEIVEDTLRVAHALQGAPKTVRQLARETRLHTRTVYRILAALPTAGYGLAVEETPRARGPGRPERRYHVLEGPA